MFEVPTLEDYKKAEKLGITKKDVDSRVYTYCWSIEKAISTPIKVSKRSNVNRKSFMLLAQKNGISSSQFDRRIRRGMSMKDAATIPVCKYRNFSDLREENGISAATFYQRIKRGMNPYEAATTPLYGNPKERKVKNS